MSFSPLINTLIEALSILPGVGPKTAQRMAYYLLQRDREGGTRLSQVLAKAMLEVGQCRLCRNLCETEICNICSQSNRDQNLICIVETPSDVAAVEQTMGYAGLYFVLFGHLSPIEGLGPEDIGIPLLEKRLSQDHFNEMIIATNPTVEGEATAYYLSDLARKYQIVPTRIAHGVPLGGELDHVDGGTLARALSARVVLE